MPDTRTDPIEEEIDYDREEVQSAKELVQVFTKTAKTLKIYLPNNPIHKKFINDLFEKLESHLLEYGALRLRIKQFELLCSGQQIYENLNRLESLSFKLFIDGMRELSFHPGLEKEEMITLLKILGQDERDEVDGEPPVDEDDDIVTLLWEKHLTHIEYIVADDFRGDIDNTKEMQPERPKPQQLNAIYNQEAKVDPTKLSPKGVEIPSLHIFKLTDEEVRSIKRELRWEEEIDIVNELEGMLFDILRIETDSERFVEVLEIIDNIFEELVFKGDFIHTRKILEFFWEMLDTEKALDPTLQRLVNKAFAQAGNPERITSLDEVLNRSSSDVLDQFLPFMVLFQKEVIPSVIELLSKVKGMKTRRVLCDVLAEIGQMDIDVIIKQLDVQGWFLLRNLIYVLGKIGDKRVIPHFSKFIDHEELKVRKEILHVLDAMEYPEAADLLIQFIADPDLSNRVYVIKSLVKKKVAEGLPILIDLIEDVEFENKAFFEKKEIFNGLAKLGGEAVVPEIEKYLKVRWHLFKNIKVDERGVCAAAALQRIGSPTAIDALRVGSQSRNKAVREACQKSLDLLSQ